MKKIDRLQFLQIAGGILGAGVATAAAACGGDDSAAGASCNPNAPIANISQNHGHSMTVTAAQVSAAVTTQYQLTGPHTHTVTVSDVNFHDLSSGRSVTAIRRPGESTATSTRSRSADLSFVGQSLHSLADEVADLLRVERLLDDTAGGFFECLRGGRRNRAAGEKDEATEQLWMGLLEVSERSTPLIPGIVRSQKTKSKGASSAMRCSAS